MTGPAKIRGVIVDVPGRSRTEINTWACGCTSQAVTPVEITTAGVQPTGAALSRTSFCTSHRKAI